MASNGERDWGAAVALALLAVLLSVVHAGLLIIVPLSLFLLALPPRRVLFVAMGIALALTLFLGPMQDGLWYVERGWVLVLSGWFVLAVTVLPSSPFLTRGLAALAASAGTAVILALIDLRGWMQLDWAVASRLRRGATEVAGRLGGVAQEGWRGQFSGAVERAADLQVEFYPALLALASLAALGVAWWASQRLAVRGSRPLAPLREFRFHNELIWVLVTGLLLALLPFGELAQRTGLNVLVFMGALYALRGAAVMVAVAGPPGIVASLLLGLAALFLAPLAALATTLVGLSDTWLDLRARVGSAASAGG